MNQLWLTLLIGLFGFNAFADEVNLSSTLRDPEYMAQVENLGGIPMDAMRVSDYNLFHKSYAAGGDLFQEFVKFLFPISGREKRTMFMPFSYWGPKKPRFHKLIWKRFESDHFDFYAYPEAQSTVNTVIKYYEEEYDRNNRIFGLDSKFTKKIPVIYYQTRRDFEQTAIVDGPIPEGLGGATEIFAWKRVTFPFEGEYSKFEHVAKHEGTHVFQIAKKARKLPLWFIEGTAETNSIYWDSDAEMIIRDAFLNGFFLHIQDLWQIEGTWLMYKIGNFICNVIWDTYGEEGLRKIYSNASSKSFENNIKDSLGITIEELDRKVQSVAQERYAGLLHHNDTIDQSKKLDERRVLLASHDRFYISGGMNGPRLAMFINHFESDGKIVSESFTEDKLFENESLESFQKGAFVNKEYITYSMKKSAIDELRIIPYLYNEKKKKYIFSQERKYSWATIDRIQDPVMISEYKVAFIGYQGGFSTIYLADLQKDLLEPLTSGKSHYSDLDYSEANHSLVYSQELKRDPNHIFYNRDLFLLDLQTRQTRRLTETENILEIQPKFSADGKRVLYSATPDLTYDLMILNLDKKIPNRITYMNVGARNAQWGTDNSILYNGFKGMAPSILQMSIPTEKEMISAEKTKYNTISFLFQNGKFVAPDQSPDPIKPEELVLDGLYNMGNQSVIRHLNQNYTIGTTATLPNKLIVKTDQGLPNDTTAHEESAPQYFTIQGEEVQSLNSTMVAQEGVPEEIHKWAELQLSGRDIIQGWMNRDHERALLLVNNRLAAEYETFRKEKSVSLFIYDQTQNHLEELPNSPIKSIKQNVQWVAFLKNDQIFFAVSDHKTGPFEAYIYSIRDKKYRVLDREMNQFRISKNGEKILWKNVGYTLADFTKPQKKQSYTETAMDDIDDEVESFEFDENNHPVFFSYSGHKKSWEYTTYVDEESKYKIIQMPRKGSENVLRAAISEFGTVAVITEDTDKKNEESVWIWQTGKNVALQLIADGDRFTAPIFRKEYLTFYSAFFDPRESSENLWFSDLGTSVVQFDLVQKASHQEKRIVFETKHALQIYDQQKSISTHVAQDTLGYALHGDAIYYSALHEDYFQIWKSDLNTNQKSLVTNTPFHKWNPMLVNQKLVYIVKSEAGKSVQLRNLETGELITSPTNIYNAIDISDRTDEIEVIAQQKLKPRPMGAEHPDGPEYPTFLQSQPIRRSLKLQNIAAAAAYDGDGIRYFFSGYADNLFSDKGVFANALFLGDTKFAAVGYSDLNSGVNVSYFFNTRDGIGNMGIDINKNIIFDRYRQLAPYIDFEYQNYSGNSSAINSFLDSTFDNQDFYLIKLGVIYSYDVSVWDRHGPTTGSRLYFRTETGFDTEDPRVANTDANIDVRIYNQFLPRFGLAHRLSGGTSQGPIPNIYLVGGNLSFRGVGFDDLVGQNYWVFSEDLRLPIFDFVGAKFFDPVDYFLGLFTRYFDVRAGIYTDLGSIWMNDEDPQFIYSVGYFINVPTIFGLIVRLNQGFAGEKNFGVWFGTNW